MARKQEKPPANNPENSALSVPQLSAEDQQAARRLATQHSVLKQLFADVSAELAIARAENDQLVQRLRASQPMIEKLTADLAEAQKPDVKEGAKSEAE